MQTSVVRFNVLTVNALTSDTGVRYASQGPGYARQVKLHAGADFPGVINEPVLAIQDGVVVGVYVHRSAGAHEEVSGRSDLRAARLGKFLAPYGFGLYVVIMHRPLGVGVPASLPFFTSSHHLNISHVRKGQRVQAGQVIGGVGKSGTNPVGGSTHLHLETFQGASGEAAARDTWFCLNPLGFQRWTPKSSGNTKPSSKGLVWSVDRGVITPCFPKSDTPRGVEGVDRPLPTSGGYPVVMYDGGQLAVAGAGPPQPTDLRAPPPRRLWPALLLAGIGIGGIAAVAAAASSRKHKSRS